MKIKLLIILPAAMLFLPVQSQEETSSQKFRSLQAHIGLGIWDRENSTAPFRIDSVGYDDIPKYLDFRGTVVNALRWTDTTGDNLLIQTVTGHFPWKDYDDDTKTTYMLQDKWELYAYLFCKEKDGTHYQTRWRMYDYTECFGVDWYAGFIPNGTTVTDVNNDGVAEIAMPYVLICRGGMDPGTMKIIAYEHAEKYALRGETRFCMGEDSYGGDYTTSKNLDGNKPLNDWLRNRWEAHVCENGRFY